MPTYIGFSTQNADAVRPALANPGVDGGAGMMNDPTRYSKKFRTLDEELVVRDFLNHLNISQGQMPGRPEFGTSLWAFVFEQNVSEIKTQIETEVRRVVGADPRIILNTVTAYPQGNGILLEIEMAVEMFAEPMTLQISLDQTTSTASLL